MELVQIVSKIGNWASYLTEKVVQFLGELAIKTEPISAKIISVIILLVLAYVVLSILNITKKFIKWALIILIILLIISIVVSIFV